MVKRVAQLARWARDRGGKGPAPAHHRQQQYESAAPGAPSQAPR